MGCIHRRSILSPKRSILANTVFLLEGVPVHNLEESPVLLACLFVHFYVRLCLGKRSAERAVDLQNASYVIKSLSTLLLPCLFHSLLPFSQPVNVTQ